MSRLPSSATTAANRARFFVKPFENHGKDISISEKIIKTAQMLHEDISLLVSQRPLPVQVARLSSSQLTEIIRRDKLYLALGIVSLLRELGAEARKGSYYLELLTDELSAHSLFAPASSSRNLFKAVKELKDKGLKFSDFPDTLRESQARFIAFAKEINISPEYLLGNLEKALVLMRAFGVRANTVNLSTLFHNAHSGFCVINDDGAKNVTVAGLLKRAQALHRQGTTYHLFKRGEFNKMFIELSLEELNSFIKENALSYHVSDAEFKKFISSVFTSEEKRLQSAPKLSIKKMIEFFKFPVSEEERLKMPAVPHIDERMRWQSTELGRALKILKPDMDWVSFSAGVNIAGDLKSLQKDIKIRARIKTVKQHAKNYSVVLLSGRRVKITKDNIADLSTENMLFDFYCLAVAEKKKLSGVLDVALEILELILTLGHHDRALNLNALLHSHFSGESYAELLTQHGITVSSSLFADALQKLKDLSHKVTFTILSGDNPSVPLQNASPDDFHEAVLSMAHHARAPRTPERILTTLVDKIVPEIAKLPAAVISPGGHDLARVVELSISGIPARYPLRRPWIKINADRLAFMGCGLEAGVRNCQGCPVNTIYERVIQTTLVKGYEDIITYEATGCFEVYTGIWPYTGKKMPSFHGVFGGAASEMLGGLAAKTARVKYALKTGQALPETQKVLHLGWGGDGATFDIGFGNLSGLFSRLQKFANGETDPHLTQRALYVCYDNEGYQNTGNQFSAATSPGMNTTTYPSGAQRPLGSDFRKKPIVEIMAEHGISFSARMNIHRPEHISRAVARAIDDGINGAFLHFLQPCTTGWKFTANDITYEISHISEEGGIFVPVSYEHGVPYLEVYPVPRNPEQAVLEMQARFKHLFGRGEGAQESLKKVLRYYREEWLRNLYLTGFDGEIAGADRYGYLEREHRHVNVKV